MPDHPTPGVYVEEVSFRSKSIEGVDTSTAGFVGMTRWGPVGGAAFPGGTEPRPITSFQEFERTYGGLEPLQLHGEARPGYLAHAVRAFFLNGGTQLHVSRVFRAGSAGDGVARLTVPVGGGASATWHARWPGRFGNVRLQVAVRRSRNVAFETKIGGSKLVQAKGAGRGAVVEITAPGLAGPRRRGAPQPELYAVAIGASGKQTFYSRSGARYTPARGCRIRIITLDITVAGDTPHTEVHRDLGLHPAHGRYIGRILQQGVGAGGSELVWLEWNPDGLGTASRRRLAAAVRLAAALAVSADGHMGGGDDGELIDAEALRGREADAAGGSAATGLAALARLDDVAIVAAPDAGTLGSADESALAAQYLVAHAEAQRYRIALVDAPPGSSVSDVRSYRGRFDSSYAALYHPWIIVADPLDPGGEEPRELALPPSGLIAGVYARNDVERGVHAAPANLALNGLLRLESEVDRQEQDVLNPEGINVVRSFEGRGMRVWGARTMSSDPEWKYVNVRRLLFYLEHSIDRGTQWAVFEPNGEPLWSDVRRTIEDFLLVQWKNGALQGSKPEEAYFVRCDRTTMTQNDLDNGRLVALIGVAPVRPAEFVIFRIGQWTAHPDDPPA